MKLALGKSGIKASDTKILSSQPPVSDCWFHSVLTQIGFSAGEGVTPATPAHVSITSQDRSLSPVPRKGSCSYSQARVT